jgi:hypothetical protein
LLGFFFVTLPSGEIALLIFLLIFGFFILGFFFFFFFLCSCNVYIFLVLLLLLLLLLLLFFNFEKEDICILNTAQELIEIFFILVFHSVFNLSIIKNLHEIIK